jgi:hypothetical protein
LGILRRQGGFGAFLVFARSKIRLGAGLAEPGLGPPQGQRDPTGRKFPVAAKGSNFLADGGQFACSHVFGAAFHLVGVADLPERSALFPRVAELGG